MNPDTFKSNKIKTHLDQKLKSILLEIKFILFMIKLG